ncbi:hypothetical protein RYX36_004709, partial [Vicia faba]
LLLLLMKVILILHSNFLRFCTPLNSCKLYHQKSPRRRIVGKVIYLLNLKSLNLNPLNPNPLNLNLFRNKDGVEESDEEDLSHIF